MLVVIGALLGLGVQRTCHKQGRRRNAHRRIRAEGKGELHKINDL